MQKLSDGWQVKILQRRKKEILCAMHQNINVLQYKTPTRLQKKLYAYTNSSNYNFC